MDEAERDRREARSFALSMYEGEPCRACGGVITRDDLEAAVFAGYSRDNRSRAAHGGCWRDGPRQEEWAYPV